MPDSKGVDEFDGHWSTPSSALHWYSFQLTCPLLHLFPQTLGSQAFMISVLHHFWQLPDQYLRGMTNQMFFPIGRDTFPPGYIWLARKALHLQQRLFFSTANLDNMILIKFMPQNMDLEVWCVIRTLITFQWVPTQLYAATRFIRIILFNFAE